MSFGAGRQRRSLARARLEAEAAHKGQPLPALPGTKRKAPRHIEDSHQTWLFDWAAKLEGARPALKLLHAVPNGGKRNAREAERMRRQGTRAGVPDIDLPVPNHHVGHHFHSGPSGSEPYIGLRIELKRPIVKGEDKPRVSPDQAQWLSLLQDAGHCCVVAYGWDQARDAIEAYLDGHPVPHQWKAQP